MLIDFNAALGLELTHNIVQQLSELWVDLRPSISLKSVTLIVRTLENFQNIRCKVII